MEKNLILKRFKMYLMWLWVNIPYTPIFAYNQILRVKLSNKRFFNPNYIQGSEILEKNWRIIKKELTNLLKNKDEIPLFQQVDAGQERITSDKKWKTFFLKVYGNYVEDNCQKCPETTKILKQVPNVYTAMFSILEGNKHIPKHFGPFKGVLRYHLGLIVPKDRKCRIKVGGQTRYWEEGKSLVFDDTYIHEVWNTSNKDRVVLFLDIERPMPNQWLRRLNKKLMDYLKNTKRVQETVENAKFI